MKAIVNVGDIDSDYGPFELFKFDREHISEIHILKPSTYSSSPDGKMILRKIVKGKSLALYLGDDVDIEIPDTVTEIGPSAIDCRNIRSVKIPESITTINSWAFLDYSPQEITLPASVKIVGLGSLLTTNIVHINGNVSGLMMAVAMAYNPFSQNNLSENFCVEYDGRWHIFPRELNFEREKEAESLIFDSDCEKGIFNHFLLADSFEGMLKSAYEIFKVRRDEETEKYLKNNIHDLSRLAIKEGEESFINFVKEFTDYGMLDFDIFLKMLGDIDENWLQAKSLILNTMQTLNSGQQKRYFDI